MVKEMTSGSPMKLILYFSIPMLIGNVFQQFYNMVDAMVVGRFVSMQALAAVGATGSMMFTILGFAMGLTTGFSIIISQRFGAGNQAGVRQAVALSIYLSIGITIVMTVVGFVLTDPLLTLMNTPPDIIEDSKTYLYVIFGGVVAGIFYNLFSSVLRALGDSKTPLYFLILASILNVVLDLIFVIIFSMGVAGVAYATIIAQLISCILCVLYMLKKYPLLRLQKQDWAWNQKTAMQLLRIGLPAAFQNSVTGLGVLILQSVVNGFGSIVVAAYTAASKVQQLATQPLFSFGLAMATYSGQNLGAGRLDRVRQGVRAGMILTIISSIAGMVLMIFCSEWLIHLFISGEEVETVAKVMEYAKIYLIVTSIFYFCLGGLLLYRNTLQGLGNAMIPMLSGFLELVVRIVLCISLPLVFDFVGIPLADIGAWIAAFVLNGVFYYRNVRILEEGRRT